MRLGNESGVEVGSLFVNDLFALLRYRLVWLEGHLYLVDVLFHPSGLSIFHLVDHCDDGRSVFKREFHGDSWNQSSVLTRDRI